MSDGPHRSLPMSRKWREFAFRSDKAAFDTDQVADALGPALKDDWKQDGCDDLMIAILGIVGTDRQTSIFDAEKAAELQTLRRDLVSGYPLRRSLLDHTIRAVANGSSGIDAACEGAENALKERAGKGRYQVEEHYAREDTDRRASKVGQRIDAAMSHYDFKSLANELSGRSSIKTPTRPPRHEGLDDGVRF